MTLPIIPFRGLYKPPGIPRVNPQHTLAAGLLDLWVSDGAVCYNLTGRTPAMSSLSGTLFGTRLMLNGQSEGFAGSNLRYASGVSTSAQRQALMTWCRPTSAVANGYMYCHGASTGSQYLLGFNTGSTFGHATLFVRSSTAASVQASASTAVMAVGTSSVLSGNISWNASEAPTLYVNGALVATGSGFSPATSDSGNVASIGGLWRGSAAGFFTGDVFFSARWSRWLTPDEHFALGNDPTCFLIYPSDRIFSQLVGTHGSSSGAGSATGLATVSGIGASLAKSIGTSSGIAAAQAVGAAKFNSAGSAIAIATASAVARTSSAAVGTATGLSIASGTGRNAAVTVGSALGAATASGESIPTSPATGTATGAASALAVGASKSAATGSALGIATAVGTPPALFPSIGLAVAASSATAAGAVKIAATGTATGQAFVNGRSPFNSALSLPANGVSLTCTVSIIGEDVSLHDTVDLRDIDVSLIPT